MRKSLWVFRLSGGPRWSAASVAAASPPSLRRPFWFGYKRHFHSCATLMIWKYKPSGGTSTSKTLSCRTESTGVKEYSLAALSACQPLQDPTSIKGMSASAGRGVGASSLALLELPPSGIASSADEKAAVVAAASFAAVALFAFLAAFVVSRMSIAEACWKYGSCAQEAKFLCGGASCSPWRWCSMKSMKSPQPIYSPWWMSSSSGLLTRSMKGFISL
mmetsp:Transcript_76866/g.222140  ORF Transcript_76866/g.222140 Transcript_76866/m.222140 type:complete len:218 (-) Transcript_76866:322-975(-)